MRSPTRTFEEDDISLKAQQLLGIMLALEVLHGGPLHPRVTGEAVRRITWAPNEGFAIKKLVLSAGWVEKIGADPKKNEPGLDKVTSSGMKHASSHRLSEEDLHKILEAGLNPPPPPKVRAPSRRKPGRGYRLGTTPEDGSPIDLDDDF